jgi:pyridoxal phosphate enzyme (YggS family)
MPTISRPRLAENIGSIRERLAQACARAGRRDEVTIVAATKTVDLDVIRWAVEAGIVDVGENHVQALRAHAPEIPGARWHFIGTLQTGSAHLVAGNADVVETLSSARSTGRLARRAADAGRVLDALIEVDLTETRSGLRPEALLPFADEVARLEGLRLIGLMTVPPVLETAEAARPFFASLRTLRDRLRETHPGVRELSMGMSQDYEVAAEEGATMVRIGTALFGERPYA